MNYPHPIVAKEGRLGSRVGLDLPLDSQVKVFVSERVSATSAILAELS